MNLIELIKNRRSCRQFDDKNIEAEKVDLITKAALMSPTSKNNRPWEFIVIDDKDILFQLSESKSHGASFLKDAPIAIAIIADTEKSDVWIEDTAIAATIIQLTAEQLDLGSCWIQIRKRNYSESKSANERVKEILKISNKIEVASVIALGYKARERRSYNIEDLLFNRLHSNIYKNNR